MNVKEVRNVYELSKVTKIPYTTLNYMIAGHDMHVSTLIELSRYFNVPIDSLINKSYGITVFREEDTINTRTSNIYEATMSTMM